MYICIYHSRVMCVYIYIYIERERDVCIHCFSASSTGGFDAAGFCRPEGFPVPSMLSDPLPLGVRARSA